MSRTQVPEARKPRDIAKRQKPFILVALLLGSLWATLPPLLGFVDTPGQLILVSASLAGIFCIGGFALASMPVMATAFMGPIVAS